MYVSVTFTLDELWLLQSQLRHEIPQQDTWHFPPASVTLNDQIADALVACTDNGLSEYTLELSRGDLLAIDFVVPAAAAAPSGIKIGRLLLLKTYRARRTLEFGDTLSAIEPESVLSANQAKVLMHDLRVKGEI